MTEYCPHAQIEHFVHDPQGAPCCTEKCPGGCEQSIIYGQLNEHLRECGEWHKLNDDFMLLSFHTGKALSKTTQEVELIEGADCDGTGHITGSCGGCPACETG